MAANNKMRDYLAIFDLDGTLFDTRSVNFFAYQKALHEEGYTLDRTFYETSCNGRYYRDYLPLLIENPSDELMERIHHRKKQLYSTFLFHCVINTHLFHIIELIRNNYHIALVTTASKSNCMDILNHFQKTSLFELIITQEDVASVKPDPEGFLKAMMHFGVKPENTIVFEDSHTGIEAAKKANAVIFKIERF